MLEHFHPAPVKPARVVVMGAGSFVGGAILARLASRGIATLALGRAQVDLLASDASGRLASLLRPDDAFVAVSAIAPCKDSRMLVDNLVLVRAMAQALAQRPVAHVLNIGSDAIYADGPRPLTEATPAAPTSIHGVMHLARELVFQAEVTSPFASLRPTLVHGVRDPHNGYGPNRFRRLAMEGKDIALFGAGEERRDHVFVDDVAELAVRILERRSTGTLNAATGNVHSFADVANLAVRISAKSVRVTTSPRTGPMPHDGYRPFDVAAVHAAFPDFRFTPFEDAYARAFKGEHHG